VLLLGSTSKPAKILSDISYETGEREESVVIGNNRKTSCINAPMINATSGDANDFGDEHHTTGAHIGVVIVPTALAMAEREGADGKSLITSIAIGYEVLTSSLRSLRWRVFISQGFHPTTIGGVFAAAVTAGKIMGLNKKGLMNSLGIAGTQAFGCGFKEGWNKRMHVGMAARIGVLSALMGQRNYEASTPGEIIEKALDMYSGRYRELVDPTQITGNKDRGKLGEEWRGMLTSWKPWPSCRFLHIYIKLALDMVEKHSLKPNDIEWVHTKENQTFHFMHETGLSTYERIMSPRDPIDAQFSIPWTVATAIIKKNISLYDYFTEEGLRNPDVLEFLHKVTGEVDPDHEAAYPWEWLVTVIIKTKDGREFTETSMEWPGNPIWMPKYKDNPGLFIEDI